MLEGELGAGQVEIANASIWTVLLPVSPLFPLRSMSSPSAVGAMCSKSAESPLFQTGLTLCIEGWNAVGPQRLRELVSTMTDTAFGDALPCGADGE